MIKVAINSLPLHSGHKSRGIGTYTKNLIELLKERKDVEIQEFSQVSEVRKADLIHYPFFDIFQKTLKIDKKFPIIVTIHDTTPLVFPEHYPPGLRGKINSFLQKLTLRRVKAVITDSISSKKDIAKYLKVDGHKIHVVYLAPNRVFKPITDDKLLDSITKRYYLPKRFALFIGSVNWNKNLVGLTQACLDEELDLCLMGKDFENKSNLNHPERKSFKEFLEKFSDSPRVHMLGFISDDHLAAIVNLASVVLLPSFYEGFGLPIVESQACGTPVITSNLSAMPEVAGEGALLINPYEVDEIHLAIRRVISDPQLAKELVKRGFENVRRFSWGKVADETVKVYRQVLHNG